MRTCPACGYVDDNGDVDGACPTPGCGGLLRPELRPTVAPRIPKRALTPILGTGVVALSVVTILVAANNTPGPAVLAVPTTAGPMWPTAVRPSAVDTGVASATPGERVPPSPAGSRSPRPRTSTAPPRPDQPAINVWRSSDDVTIPDGESEANSVITVSGRAGPAPSELRVWVDVKHKARGDLAVDLIGPSGRAFPLPASGIGVNVNSTYTVDASAEPCSGTWRLRVRDLKKDGSVGYVDAWSLEF